MADERFLGRWARLKRGAQADAPAPAREGGPSAAVAGQAPRQAPASPVDGARAGDSFAGAPALDATTARPEDRREDLNDPRLAALPRLDSLGRDSDFSMFMRAGVDPDLRRSALKKLFTDPHFNRMDGLDIYIGDYSKPDPIPLALLRQLHQSRILGLSTEEPAPEEGPPSAQSADDARGAREAIADAPAAGASAADEPVADASAVDEPAVDEPVADASVADEPVADASVAHSPVAVGAKAGIEAGPATSEERAA